MATLMSAQKSTCLSIWSVTPLILIICWTAREVIDVAPVYSGRDIFLHVYSWMPPACPELFSAEGAVASPTGGGHEGAFPHPTLEALPHFPPTRRNKQPISTNFLEFCPSQMHFSSSIPTPKISGVATEKWGAYKCRVCVGGGGEGGWVTEIVPKSSKLGWFYKIKWTK